MVKVSIRGYSSNEGKRVFEILERERLEAIIEELDPSEIFQQTFKKAQGYNLSGRAITYLDARNGEIKTYWIQQNTDLHPWDRFYEITLCVVETPVEDPPEDWWWIDDEEEKEWKESELTPQEFIETKYGEEELAERWDAIIDSYAEEFNLDYNNIKTQLDDLYVNSLEL